MSTTTAQRSPSTSTHPYFTAPSPVSSVVPDLEPDEAWKENKKREIEDGFQSLIQDAKDRLEANMQALPFQKDSPEWISQRDTFFEEYQTERTSIRALAMDEFLHSVAQERVMRRMATGGSVNATVGQSVMEEQAAIYAQIQKSRRDSTAAPVPRSIIPRHLHRFGFHLAGACPESGGFAELSARSAQNDNRLGIDFFEQ
ncbi:hypothetical protein B0H13DRAFT_899660 [Mycena leptocephala]|nr:hypothetical protein B0H13DRAFT_899660 [Mycena leptocephala]